MTVKANVTSWRNINIGDAFETCLNMNRSGNPYGLSTSDTVVDPHMLKNDEWGAVAYLSKSVYGKETEEIYINNNSNFITGIAGNTVSASSSAETTNTYSTIGGVEASTTGNITGVYDMSGGNWERTAAYINNGHENLSINGGDLVLNGTSSRYRNIYTVGNSDSLAGNYEVSIPENGFYGDAIYETCSDTIDINTYQSNWFNDFSYFPESEWPFFDRGGAYSSVTNAAGVFSFGRDNGSTNNYAGFRVVISVL